MTTKLTARHCQMTDELRAYATKKTDRLLKHFDRIHSIEMIMEIEGGKPKVELIVGVVRGKHCVAEESADDFTTAVDRVTDKLVRQLQKMKGKLRERHGKAEAETPVLTEEEVEGEE